MSSSPGSAITLDQTFQYASATHNYNIYWTSLGSIDRPPLIFIHGTPWSSKVWHTYVEAFSKYFRVYLFDNPGFGESPLGQPLPGKENSITKDIALDGDLAQQSEVFAALYKYWGKEWDEKKAHVVAHDHAGLMSFRGYLLHGCDYASLCLINVVAVGPFGKPLFKLIADHEEVFNAFTGPVFEGVVESYIRDAAYTELDKERMDMLKSPWIDTEEGRSGLIRQMMQANSRSTDEVESRYSEVGKKIPIHIIWGREDKWIPVETAYRLKDQADAQSVTEIAGAGHLVMYDQEGKLGVELGVWLSQVELAENSPISQKQPLGSTGRSLCNECEISDVEKLTDAAIEKNID